MAHMTNAQRVLARHALGLPNSDRRSYRNRFYVGEGGKSHKDWLALVAAGFARRYPPHDGGRCDLFVLTIDGARLALNQGETLCPEDFPAN